MVSPQSTSLITDAVHVYKTKEQLSTVIFNSPWGNACFSQEEMLLVTAMVVLEDAVVAKVLELEEEKAGWEQNSQNTKQPKLMKNE